MAKNNQKPNKRIYTYLPYIIAGVLVLALAAIILLGNAGGPVSKLRTAAQKTLFADNFTSVFEISVNGEEYDGILNAAADPDKRELIFYLHLEANTGDYICGIYENTFALCDVNTNDLYTQDVTPRVTAFFDAMESSGKPDWAVLLDFSDYNLYEAVSNDFDFAVLTACIGKLLKSLDNTNWSASYAGYTKDREDGVTLYKFRPDPYTLVCQAMPMFRDAFRDPAQYSALEQYVEDARYLLTASTADFTFGTQYGRLVSAELELKYHNAKIDCEFEFIGINSTSVDYDTIAFYIEQAGLSPEDKFSEFG